MGISSRARDGDVVEEDEGLTLNWLRYSCCLVMSVARIRELIWRSSGARRPCSWSSTPLSIRQLIAERQWWFSSTDVF